MNIKLSATLCTVATMLGTFSLFSGSATTDPVELGKQLLWACELNQLGRVQTLLAAGAPVDQVDRLGKTPLYWAANNGAENKDCTPLYLATQNGHKAIVQALLTAGALVDQMDSEHSTPLHVAAQKNHEEVVQTLLAAGASVDQADCRGYTPLRLAALNGHKAVVLTLLKYDAQLPTQDRRRTWNRYTLGFLKQYASLVEIRAEAAKEWHKWLEEQYKVPRNITRLIWDFGGLPENQKPAEPGYCQGIEQRESVGLLEH